MKTRMNMVVWGVVTATCMLTLPAFAQPKDKDTKDSKYERSELSAKQIGALERANKIIGREVRTSDNEKAGKIDDVIFDFESGRILYVVVSSGGVAGVGDKKLAVAPTLFSDVRGETFHINVDKAKLQAAPEFTKDQATVENLGQPAFVTEVHKYFGQQAWWEGAPGPAGTGKFNNVQKASNIKGMAVKNVQDEKIGDLHTVMFDLPAGRVAYAIFEPDRELKLGDNLYALPPMALTRSTDGKFLVCDIDKGKLASAPHFDKNNWPDLSNPSWASRVYQFYGKQAYFEGAQPLRPTSEREKERSYPEKEKK